jgi:DNA-binding IclR family transcriptional regulator
VEELVSATALNLEQVRAALETLQRQDVIVRRKDRYFYTVELMRRWVERREAKQNRGFVVGL